MNIEHTLNPSSSNKASSVESQSEGGQDLISQYFGSGGGTLADMSPSIQADEFSGTANFVLPLIMTPARGVTPELNLTYRSTAGHSPFGLGMNINIPKISYRTSGTGVPKYQKDEVFSYSNGDYLLPLANAEGKRKTGIEDVAGVSYLVQEYLPRSHEKSNRIEQFTNSDNAADVFWRVTTSDNTVMIFGRTELGKVKDPHTPANIFSWLLEEIIDNKGNHQLIDYLSEDTVGVDLTSNSLESSHTHTAGRYLSKISYGNRSHGTLQPYLLTNSFPDVAWNFEVLFDYGQYNTNLSNDRPDQVPADKKWAVRQDSYSRYNSGFEVRTHRLCHNIMLFHRFDQLSKEYPVLVKRWQLEYEQTPSLSLLSSITEIGLIYQAENRTKPYRAEFMPPIELNFQAFNGIAGQFKTISVKKGSESLKGLNAGRYQLVDIFQEGIPSVVYRDDKWMYFRKPETVKKSEVDGQYEISYGLLKRFPELPSGGGELQAMRLTNVNAKGQIELVQTEPGKAGYYACEKDGEWQNFIPFDAFPSEFNNAHAHYADLTGEGSGDLVMIGPKSVRYYANKMDKGFAIPKEVSVLPDYFPTSLEGDGNAIIGFSDMLGNGQSHLFRIHHNKIEVWPNLGYGRFGQRILMQNSPQLDDVSFMPEAIFLADLDGSGTSDLIYVDGNKAYVYLNQSGNSFADAFIINMPSPFNSINQVSFADIYGVGSAAMILTVNENEVQHYVYDFSQGNKPYLLKQINDNRGKNSSLDYTSSSHEYLAAEAKGNNWLSRLPLAVQLVKNIWQQDEINQLTLEQTYNYYHGYYDFTEREFRGFGKVERKELEIISTTSSDISHKITQPSTPLCVVSWYHTGNAEFTSHFNQFKQEFYSKDKLAVPMKGSWFDQGKLTKNTDIGLFEQNAHRGLKGKLLRREVYGMEADECRSHPYTVSEQRYRVRFVQASPEQGVGRGCIQPRLLESLHYTYDEKVDDPKITHQIVQDYDNHGYMKDSLAINYPRRQNNSLLYQEESQKKLVIIRQQQSYIHQTAGNTHLLGLLNNSRHSQLSDISMPEGKLCFNFEFFRDKALSAEDGTTLALKQYQYVDVKTEDNKTKNILLTAGIASEQGLLSHTETAVLNKAELEQLLVREDNIFVNQTALFDLLQQGGYTSSINDEYYWRPSERREYLSAVGFYQLEKSIDAFGNTTLLEYDSDKQRPIKVKDALNNEAFADWNYRLLKPYKIFDHNDNCISRQYSGLGEIARQSYSGQEKGLESGFEILSLEDTTSITAESLLESPLINVGDFSLVQIKNNKSWMGRITLEDITAKDSSISNNLATDMLNRLQESRWLTNDGYLRLRARKEIKNDTFSLPFNDLGTAEQQNTLKTVLGESQGQPISQLTVTATDDVYQNGEKVNQKNTRLAIIYQDGFGRLLQKKVKVENGKAFTVNVFQELELVNAQPKEEESDNRWLTSGRTIFNQKGLPIQEFEPYYLNTEKFIDHQQLSHFGLSQIHEYDGVGRKVKTISAKGFITSSEFSAWYRQDSDENDTLIISPYYQANFGETPDTSSPYYDAVLVNNMQATSAKSEELIKQRAIDARFVVEQIKPMQDTPVTQVFDAQGNLVMVEKLDVVIITTESFNILGLPDEQLNTLISTLKSAGVVTQANTLKKNFCGSLPVLPSQFNEHIDAIQLLLNQIHTQRQHISRQYFDVQNRLLRSSDARLEAINENNQQNYYNFLLQVKSINCDSGTVWQLPNAVGGLLWKRDLKGTELKAEYDQLQRITGLIEGGAYRERYIYGDSSALSKKNNTNNKLIAVYDQSGRSVTQSYNLNNQPTELYIQYSADFKKLIDWPADNNRSLALLENKIYNKSNIYNARGELKSETDDENNLMFYRYFPSGRLQGVWHKPNGGDEKKILSDIQYAANGLVLSEVHSGAVSEYEYEKTTLRLLRVVSKKASNNRLLRDQRYSYDPTGNVVIIRNAAAETSFSYNDATEPVCRYQYDGLYRLKQAKGRKQSGTTSGQKLPNPLIPMQGNPHLLHSYTQKFEYDKGGNMIQSRLISDVSSNLHFSVHATSNKSVQSDQNKVVNWKTLFDPNGNQLLLSNSNLLHWDFKNQLQKVIINSRSGEKNDAEYYLYDYSGKRVRKITERYTSGLDNVDVEEVRYLGNLHIRTRGQRAVSSDHSAISVHQELIVNHLSAGFSSQSRYLHWKKGLPGNQKNSQYRALLSDHLCSVNLELNQNAEIISFEEYFAFGGTAVYATQNQVDVSLKHYRYNGRERDDSTGLYYFGMRYYAPWKMRWISTDPLGMIDGLNLYQFVRNNPVTWTDPNGLASQSRLTSDPEVEVHNTNSTVNTAQDLEDTASQKDSRDKMSKNEEVAQKKTQHLIEDMVSIYLNATLDNLEISKITFDKKYKELKSQSNLITAEQLGQSFKNVGAELFVAVKASDSGDSSKNSKNGLGQAFDNVSYLDIGSDFAGSIGNIDSIFDQLSDFEQLEESLNNTEPNDNLNSAYYDLDFSGLDDFTFDNIFVDFLDMFPYTTKDSSLRSAENIDENIQFDSLSALGVSGLFEQRHRQQMAL